VNRRELRSRRAHRSPESYRRMRHRPCRATWPFAPLHSTHRATHSDGPQRLASILWRATSRDCGTRRVLLACHLPLSYELISGSGSWKARAVRSSCTIRRHPALATSWSARGAKQ
jgi:hypothetical protein